jgi:hypothetical protein
MGILMVFENRVLRRISERKIEEVMGDLRRLHNEKLHRQGGQIKETEVGGTCSTHGRGEKCAQKFHRETRRKETT